MRPTGRAVAALYLLAVTAGCGGQPPSEHPPTMFRGDAAHSGVFAGPGIEGHGRLLWRFETDGPVRSSPVVAGGMLYVGSTDGHLYALDRGSGEELWRVDAGSPVSSTPAVAGGVAVFAGRDGIIHAVDAATGERRWQYATGELHPWDWGSEGWDVYVSSPTVQDGIVVFGAGDGSIYALALDTGDERWRVATGGRVRSTPAIADGTVFAGSADGIVYALALDAGEEIWRHETEGVSFTSADFGFDRKSIIASPAVVGGTVYVGSRDGHMYALDQATGEMGWRVSHDVSWAMSSPAVSGGVLFSGTSDGLFVHRVDVTTGEETWRFSGEGYTWSSPALAGSTLYIGDGAGYLRALDADSGAERWSFPTAGGVYSSPWVGDGAVYFGADDGGVYALVGGAPVHRAVFWDPAFTAYTLYRHEETRVLFQQSGYRMVNAGEAASFMEARIADGESSVVVFAIDHAPAEIAAEPSDTVLLRRYLDAGGKVVWLGTPPMSLARDETGRVTAIDRTRSQRLLDVDFGEANFDFYASIPTAVGRTWGLERGWVSTHAIAPSPDIDVLAVDENGRAGAWVRSYGGPAGTGFVAMGLHDATPVDLDGALALAEFGLGGGR